VDRDDHVRVMVGRVLIQALVWTVSVEMVLVLTQHCSGVLLVVDEYPVGALGSDALDKPLGKGVGLSRQSHLMSTMGSGMLR
jgi:hypothetical protein